MWRGLFHGFELWVNLPARRKMTPARYQDIRGGAVKLLSSCWSRPSPTPATRSLASQGRR